MDIFDRIASEFKKARLPSHKHNPKDVVDDAVEQWRTDNPEVAEKFEDETVHSEEEMNEKMKQANEEIIDDIGLGRMASDDDEIIDDIGLGRMASDDDEIIDDIGLMASDDDDDDDSEKVAVKHISQGHARAISKGVKKSMRGQGAKNRQKKTNKTRRKPMSPGAKAQRRQRKKYKTHGKPPTHGKHIQR
jgi:hypothetical protein